MRVFWIKKLTLTVLGFTLAACGDNSKHIDDISAFGKKLKPVHRYSKIAERFKQKTIEHRRLQYRKAVA